MGGIVELLLLTVLCASAGRVQGECRHVQNDDMLEYSCVGGQLSDLNSLPQSTGKIRISDMPVSRITTDTFSRFGSDLWVLGCSHCGIMDIEPGAFQRLENLQQLSLDNNRLTTIRESWFRGLNYLTYLDLNYNNIEFIEDGVFTNLPSVVDLRLSGNRLECLNLEDMSNLRELKRIFLTENSEFKCPNAVSAFLENRGVSYEKDQAWSRISVDLVDVPADYYDEDIETTSAPTTPLPTYRERLHLPSVAPSPPVESTPSYVPPRLHTTEEVVFRPVYLTPDWRQTQEATTPYVERVQPTTSRSTNDKVGTPYDDVEIPYDDVETPYDKDGTPYDVVETPYDKDGTPYDDIRVPYTPPRTIAPLDPVTYPPYDTTSNSLDATTSRSWPRFPESTSARPGYPVYPPHGNEDRRYEQPYYSSEATDTFPLAPGPSDQRETTSFVESTMEQTTNPYGVDWTDRGTISPDTRYPVDNIRPEYRAPVTDVSSTHVVRPVPPEVFPAAPDFYQPPYYEPPATVHPPTFMNNLPQQEIVTPIVVAIETSTTDKPLPDCPTRNSSSSVGGSFEVIFVSVLLFLMRDVLVEGF